MKSEHRHDLKTNELRRLLERLGPFYEKFGNQLLLGLAAVILVGGVATWWVQNSSESEAAGWTEMAKCRSAQDYARVADRYKNTAVGAWAMLSEAESHLRTGLQLSFLDREAAVSDLRTAKKRFDTLLNAELLPDEARERALFGLARCVETLSGGDTTEAVTAYENLLEAFPKTVFAETAKERIEALNTGGTQQFYAWFQKQNPKPEDRQMPKDGSPEKDPLAGHIDEGEPGTVTLPEIPYLLQLPEQPPQAEGPESKAPEGKQAPPVPDKGSDEKTAPQKKAPPKSDGPAASEKKPAGKEKPAGEEKPAPEPSEKTKEPAPPKDSPEPK